MDYNAYEIIEKLIEFLPLLLPVILLQWALMVYALVKLLKSQRPPTLMPKWGWGLVIVLVNIVGPVLYLIIGRKDE